MDNDVNFVLTTQAPKVRDLYDDDFESEDEDIVDMEFEPDVFKEDPIFMILSLFSSKHEAVTSNASTPLQDRANIFV
ncbi:hypothetical protein F2Q70_00001221 [Brassica cretica]|uniref:Uncharacterized protein n=1 Tax=Brassica cretica TaxID=69181 RepID=A0A8S9IYB5_BRACR|nr:hypothetical protein F2Q70_00001221 [Brassica cretica]